MWASVCFDQSKLVNQAFKKSDLTCSNHFFQKLFKPLLSLRLGKALQRIFSRFPPNFLQIFSLPKLVCLFTLLFALFFTFSCIISWFLGNFRTFLNLGFLMNQALFYEFDQWVLLLQWCIHDLYWLIWSIWGFVKN